LFLLVFAASQECRSDESLQTVYPTAPSSCLATFRITQPAVIRLFAAISGVSRFSPGDEVL
jgi:hypothetical protein